ncbi:ubiquinone biosynthesis protein COQ7, mitochondrial isoform X1 [Megachile rotundata]|uniref:ubiquinone biosynthesis protein COQ7, mitochondrial isoform X1 n=2 Tax=Megachile rotundata TaxID=143995 RepID=UPI000615046F|nr:PREDICTED: ubiquinone biosynthesis protein COQ7 homolog isoform X1 [Megachile rotundata]
MRNTRASHGPSAITYVLITDGYLSGDHRFPVRISKKSIENMLHLKQLGIRLASTSAASRTTASGKLLDTIIRVDHAGELGADRIYAGQMAVLGRTAVGPTIQHMWDQEKKHRAKFEELIQKYRVRPTVLTPLWNVAGFVLGAGTALMGEKAAMACTVAVETVITEHYNDQLRRLMESNEKIDKEILETIKKFRDEEQEHHDTGIDHGAEQAPFYQALTNVIKCGCKAAISVSKVI